MKKTRLEHCFAALKSENRSGLVAFITAGDPCFDDSLYLLKNLPKAGVDIIELGMPFTDPMADGPAIQASSLRALKTGQTMVKTLQMVSEFRKSNDTTPVVLMGYYNPIYIYGVDRFLEDAKKAGVDGLIVVDLPPEEDSELCIPTSKAGLSFIRLATPTTDSKRLPVLLGHSSGFVYYVSVAGITGVKTAEDEVTQKAVSMLKQKTHLPIAVGFGIKTPDRAAAVARYADAVVVGSAIVQRIAKAVENGDNLSDESKVDILDFVQDLSQSVRLARVK